MKTRVTIRRCLVALTATALLSVGTAHAEDPLRLARGLRDDGLADLALEYLADLAKQSPAPEVLVVLPLERASARLDLAAASADPAKRLALLGEAERDFDAFLKANGDHPRRAEATVALARLASARARAQSLEGFTAADEKALAEVQAKTRALYALAVERFKPAVVAAEAARARPDLSPEAQKLATSEYFQVRLDEAEALRQLARAFPASGGADAVTARGAAFDAAAAKFDDIAKSDSKQPAAFVARAYAGECLREKGDSRKASAAFAEVKAAAAANPLAGRGARTVRFLEARAAYEAAFAAPNRAAAFASARAGLETWLREAGRDAPSADAVAARYYVALSKLRQAQALATKKGDVVTVPDSARDLARQSERDFRKLAAPENDYTARAAEDRSQAIRLLIGDLDKADPARYSDPAVVAMAAQLQLGRAARAEGDERAKLAAQALAFYDRLAALPAPAGGALREQAEAKVGQLYAAVLAGNFDQAVALGEPLAKRLRGPSAARAALYTAEALRKRSGDPAAKAANLARAVAVVTALDQTAPQDPASDSARLMVAQELYAAKRPAESLALAERVPSTSLRALNARMLESFAALDLVRQAPPAPESAAAAKRVLDRLEALPGPDAAPDAEAAKLAGLAQLQRVELALALSPPDLAGAEKVAESLAEPFAKSAKLAEADRRELQLRLDYARARVGYGRALTEYQANNFAAAAATLDALLKGAQEPAAKGLAADSPLLPAAARLDDFRRDRLLSLALLARVREGKPEQLPALLDTLARLGGGGAGAVSALLDGVRPQLDQLRAKGQGAEADKVARAIGQFLSALAAKPGTPPGTLLLLGRGLRELGSPEQAVAILKQVPAPPPAELTAPPSSLKGDSAQAVARYRQAQLELARALRQARDFAGAEQVLAGAQGWPSPGEFKKEAIHLTEGKASAAPPAEAAKLWADAYKRWGELANQSLSPLRKVLAAKRDSRSAVQVLADFKQLPPAPGFVPTSEAELKSALAAPAPMAPEWLEELSAGATPRAKDYQAQLTQVVERLEGQLRPAYQDALAESYRCLSAANLSLLKDKPDQLKSKLDGVAKALAAFEKANPTLTPAVRGKLARLVAETPQLKGLYEAAGGKLFLSAE